MFTIFFAIDTSDKHINANVFMERGRRWQNKTEEMLTVCLKHILKWNMTTIYILTLDENNKQNESKKWHI
jgi:hypothetical protein